MGEVVSLSKPQVRIWVCNCGCSTFELQDNGEALCAACQSVADVDGSGWATWTAESRHDEASAFTDVQGNGSVEFAQRRVAKLATDPTAKMLLVVLEDGSISLWTAAETDKETAWAKRKLRAALALLKRKAG